MRTATQTLAAEAARVTNCIATSRLERLYALSGECFGINYSQPGQLQRCWQASTLAELPNHLGRPEVAFCGESNAGKSTLLQSLFFYLKGNQGPFRAPLGLKSSGYPGATKLVSWYSGGDGILTVLDTPGYGYRGKIKSKHAPVKFAQQTAAVHQILAARGVSALHKVYVLADLLHGRLTPHDNNLIQVCRNNGIPVCVVLTKVDEAADTEKLRTLWTVRDQLEAAGYSSDPTDTSSLSVPVIACSAQEQTNMQLLRLDILNTVTKWLPEEDLTAERIRTMQYTSAAPLSAEALADLARRHPAPLADPIVMVRTRRMLGLSGGEKDKELLGHARELREFAERRAKLAEEAKIKPGAEEGKPARPEALQATDFLHPARYLNFLSTTEAVSGVLQDVPPDLDEVEGEGKEQGRDRPKKVVKLANARAEKRNRGKGIRGMPFTATSTQQTAVRNSTGGGRRGAPRGAPPAPGPEGRRQRRGPGAPRAKAGTMRASQELIRMPNS